MTQLEECCYISQSTLCSSAGLVNLLAICCRWTPCHVIGLPPEKGRFCCSFVSTMRTKPASPEQTESWQLLESGSEAPEVRSAVGSSGSSVPSGVAVYLISHPLSVSAYCCFPRSGAGFSPTLPTPPFPLPSPSTQPDKQDRYFWKRTCAGEPLFLLTPCVSLPVPPERRFLSEPCRRAGSTIALGDDTGLHPVAKQRERGTAPDRSSERGKNPPPQKRVLDLF